MKPTILIDINHPAHVHFFKNLYFELIKRGHKVNSQFERNKL